ncbi:hypothetical protein ACSENX_27700 [Pseudomonas aeruginosa]
MPLARLNTLLSRSR